MEIQIDCASNEVSSVLAQTQRLGLPEEDISYQGPTQLLSFSRIITKFLLVKVRMKPNISPD